MSNFDLAQSPSRESTYGPRGNPQLNAFARRIFFLSVGSAAAPVIIAAGIMLHSGQGLPSKRLLAKSRSPEAMRSVAPLAMQESEPASTTSSSRVAADRTSQIPSPPLAGFDAEIARRQSPPEDSDIFQQEKLVRLTVVSVPTNPGIPDTNSAVAEERSAADRTAPMAAGQTKKSRAEVKTHTIARHHRRPQKHTPPSLLAKIGQSVKKGLMEAAKFPREAMAGHRWE
jgi:hypothetical protein